LVKPVNQGFIFLQRQGDLKKAPLLVNLDRKGNYQAKSDLLGDPVLTGLVPFTENRISVDLRGDGSLPLLKERDFYYLPSYKSGGVILLRANQECFVQGVLIDAGGKPLKRASGDFVKESGTRIPFFGDDRGEFFVGLPEPGEWAVQLSGSEYSPTQLTVEDRGEYPIQLGEILVGIRAGFSAVPPAPGEAQETNSTAERGPQ